MLSSSLSGCLSSVEDADALDGGSSPNKSGSIGGMRLLAPVFGSIGGMRLLAPIS